MLVHALIEASDGKTAVRWSVDVQSVGLSITLRPWCRQRLERKSKRHKWRIEAGWWRIPSEQAGEEKISGHRIRTLPRSPIPKEHKQAILRVVADRLTITWEDDNG